MRVYVSGPIASMGVEAARPIFRDAAEQLVRAGHAPLDPLHAVRVPGPAEMPDRGLWARALNADLVALLVRCDGVATLDGWQYSEGAKLEVHVASLLDMTVAPLAAWTTASVAALEHDVRAERRRQRDLHGDQSRLPDGTGGPDAHLQADLLRRMTQAASDDDSLTWAMILVEEVAEALAETRDGGLADELLQVEAVARAWREALLQPRSDGTGRPLPEAELREKGV